MKQYASDMDCFVPLMDKFKQWHGKYPVADAGYGSMNNYLYCEEHGMKKYIKFKVEQGINKSTAKRVKRSDFRNFNDFLWF